MDVCVCVCMYVCMYYMQSLVLQLEEAAKQARQQAHNLQEANASTSPHTPLPTAASEGSGDSGWGPGRDGRGNVPGLQDLKGYWSGAFQAYGGGGGAANTDFDVKGADWQWGNYRMDQVRAAVQILYRVTAERLTQRNDCVWPICRQDKSEWSASLPWGAATGC